MMQLVNSIFGIYIRALSGLSKEIWLLSTALLINRTGTMVFYFLSLYLAKEMAFEKPQIGIVLLCFGLGSIAGTFIGGKLTDKIGFMPVMLASLLLGGIGFFGLQYIRGYVEICTYAFFLSIAAEAFRPAVMASIGVFSKKENQARSIGLIRLAINLGVGLGSVVGGIMASRIGYFSIFWVDGITCVLAAIFLFFYFKDYIFKKKDSDILDDPTLDEEPVDESHLIASPWKNKRFLLFFLVMTLISIVFTQLLSTIPLFYKEEVFLTEEIIGYVLAINAVLIIALEMPIVHHYEKLDPLKPSAWGLVLIGLAFAIFLIAPTLWVCIISMIVLTLGEIFLFPFTNTFVLNESPAATRGEYMALYAITFSISQVISPVLGTNVAHIWNFNVLWIICAILSFISYLLILKLIKNPRVQ